MRRIFIAFLIISIGACSSAVRKRGLDTVTAEEAKGTYVLFKAGPNFGFIKNLVLRNVDTNEDYIVSNDFNFSFMGFHLITPGRYYLDRVITRYSNVTALRYSEPDEYMNIEERSLNYIGDFTFIEGKFEHNYNLDTLIKAKNSIPEIEQFEIANVVYMDRVVKVKLE